MRIDIGRTGRFAVPFLVVTGSLLLAPAEPLEAQFGRPGPLLMGLGAQGGMVELGSGSGRFPYVGVIVQSGPPEGLQLRLGAQSGLMEEATLIQLETLMLLNVRFGARLHFGAGVGVNWLTGETSSEVQIPLIALGAMKRPIGPWMIFLEGAAYYGFLAEETVAFRWGIGAMFSF